MALDDVKAKLTNYLTEAVVEICKSGLSYRTQFSVEGLLGVTLDEDKVILININETVKNRFANIMGNLSFGGDTKQHPGNPRYCMIFICKSIKIQI